MLTIAFIAFRESLEMLLVGAAVYSALVEHKIRRKRELVMGAASGLLLSILIFSFVSFARSKIHFDVHELGEIIEGVNYLMTGIFLLFTALFLHTKMRQIISLSPSTLLTSSVFAIGFLSVLREGVEIVLFSISNSIGSTFVLSLAGLFLGMGCAIVIGIVGIKFTIARVAHEKLLFISEWGIRFLALYFIVKGVIGFAEFIF